MITIKNRVLKRINHLKEFDWKTILVYILIGSIILHCFYMFYDFQIHLVKRWVNKISLSLFFIAAFLLILLLTHKRISSWLSVTVNPELMVLTRKLYASLCLFSAIQHFSLIPYGLEPYNLLLLGIPVPGVESYFLSSAYIVSLLLLFFGCKIRLAWILTFLLGGLVIPFSLEIFLKNIFNFYAIFISVDLWKGKKTTEGSWAIILMCLSASILMTMSGLHKLLDPVWQEGLGFYYSLNISFFPDRYLWKLLDYKGLMFFFNWSTIIVELIALPLFLFKRTWSLVILCFLGLVLFLTFAMSGIGIMGGPIIFCMILLFLSLTNVPQKVTQFFTKRNTIIPEIRSKAFGTFLSSNTVGLIIFWVTILISFHNFFQDFKSNKFRNPPVFGNFINTQQPTISPKNPLIYKLDYFDRFFLAHLQPHKFWQFTWSISLFNYHHLFDRLYFKVIFTDYADKEVELIHYFDEDGAISEKHPLIANERFLLSCFRMMDAVRCEPYVSSSRLKSPMDNELKGLIMYSLKNADDKHYKKATIYVKQMHQPFGYEGNFKPWIQKKWIGFYVYDMKSKKGKINSRLENYEFDKLEIEAFKRKIIVPNFK